MISLFAVFLGLVIAAVVVVITGSCAIYLRTPCPGAGSGGRIALMGIGLILTVVGVAASVAAVKLCAVAIPAFAGELCGFVVDLLKEGRCKG